MKKNAFTTVELVVSFTLTAVISLVVFQMIISLKNIYVKVGIKTNLITKQSLVSRNINRDLNNKTITNLATCGNDCIEITYTDSITKQLKIDKDNYIISYGDYSAKIVDGSTFGDEILTITNMYEVSTGTNNSILNIKIPIYHKLYKDENYGINIVYQFNDNETPLFEVNF